MYTFRFEKADFQEISDSIAPLMDEDYVRMESDDDGVVVICVWSESIATEIRKYYTRIQKRDNWAIAVERRKENLYLKSGGLYTDSDIDDIFKIQEGLCYYTGQPLLLGHNNFSIDHIIPISDYGSNWPGNIALTTKSINMEKRIKSKAQFFKTLADRFGTDFVTARKDICKKIDRERRKIDKARKKEVSEKISEIITALENTFEDHDIRLAFSEPALINLTLSVENITTTFPPGFIRRKYALQKIYYIEVIKSLIRE